MPKSLYRIAQPLALTLLILSGISACQSSNKEEATSDKTSNRSDANCSGSLNSSALSAVANLVGSNAFRIIAPHGGASGTAKDLISKYRTRGVTATAESDLCLIYKTNRDLNDLAVSFSFASEVPSSGKVASVFTQYKMGALALAGNQTAVIYLECTSNRFDSDGGQETLIIRGEARNRYAPDHPSYGAPRYNLTVVHSGSFALAQALHCKNNAGLTKDFKMPEKA